MKRVNPQQVRGLLAVLTLLAPVGVWFGWAHGVQAPRVQALEALEARRAELAQLEARGRAAAAAIPALRTRVRYLEEVWARARAYLAPVPQPERVEALRRAARQAGVALEALNRAEGGVAPQGLRAERYELRVTGSFPQVLAFLREVYALPWIARADQVQLSVAGGEGGRARIAARLALDFLTQGGAR